MHPTQYSLRVPSLGGGFRVLGIRGGLGRVEGGGARSQAHRLSRSGTLGVGDLPAGWLEAVAPTDWSGCGGGRSSKWAKLAGTVAGQSDSLETARGLGAMAVHFFGLSHIRHRPSRNLVALLQLVSPPGRVLSPRGFSLHSSRRRMVQRHRSGLL